MQTKAKCRKTNILNGSTIVGIQHTGHDLTFDIEFIRYRLLYRAKLTLQNINIAYSYEPRFPENSFPLVAGLEILDARIGECHIELKCRQKKTTGDMYPTYRIHYRDKTISTEICLLHTLKGLFNRTENRVLKDYPQIQAISITDL